METNASCWSDTDQPFSHDALVPTDYEYQGWSVEQRAEVLRQATAAIKQHMYCGISVLFSQAEFEQTAPPLWRFEDGSIYATACQMVLRTTAVWMDENRCFLPIAYAFESGHRFWNEADSILKGIGQHHPQLKELYRYRTHFSLEKTEAYGLQAADLLAWAMTRITVGVPKNHTMSAFGPILLNLVKGDDRRYRLFHPNGDLLQRFFEEQANTKHIIVDLAKAKKMRLR